MNGHAWSRYAEEPARAPDRTTTGSELKGSTAQGLFSFLLPSRVLAMLQNMAGTPYDVASDGQRLLIITRPEPRTTAAPMTVILNWTALRKG
jgi:hypothetical protein